MKRKTIDPKKLYTPEEAAEILKTPTYTIKAATVKNHCRSGKLNAKQIGLKKVWHVPGSSLLSAREEWGLNDTA